MRRYSTKATEKVNVEIDKYDDQNDNRTWVNTDRFGEFRSEYQELQDSAPLSSEVRVEFELVLNLNKLVPEQISGKAGQRLIGKQMAGPKLTGKYTRIPEVRKSWFPITNIMGGIQGVRLYIKNAVTNSVFRWEDSQYEIESIGLTRLYMSKQKQSVSVDFKDIKMYNGVFNYMGYGLLAMKNEIENTCVPTYMLKLLNDPGETNPRKRLKKLNMEKLLDELKMASVTDGCSVKQIAEFCDNHKITYYVLNYKYKLFETNNHMHFRGCNLPRLVFMCAQNHLFPIEDHDKRETIFKTYANIGGMVKTKSIKKEKDETKYIPESIYEHDLGMSIYERIQYIQSLDTKKKRLVTTQKGACHDLFFSELHRGNIHNKNVKTNKENQIVGFEMDSIQIEENANYRDVVDTIERLNIEVDNKRKKKNECPAYVYRGQSPHSLAYEYYLNNYSKNITSICSPQVHDILTDSGCMNSPFLEFDNSTGTTAYDINKQYTNILHKCDDFGWSQFMPTDEAQPYDGKIETGMYFIETENCRPLKGNGWYWDIIVWKSLNYGLIDHEDIKYQVKSSSVLPKSHFEQFVNDIYDKFGEAKMAINGFVGMLGRHSVNRSQIYYESDFNVVANEITNNPQLDFNIKGIYPNCLEGHVSHQHVNLLNLNDDALSKVISEHTEDVEPLLYQISSKKSIPKYENTLAIHRKIYDIANMEMYELYMKVAKLNPACEFVGIKTDCLVFNKITTDIETSNEWGKPKKCEVPKIHACTVDREPKVRTDTYELSFQEWQSIEPDSCNDYIDTGYLTVGMAGTGKTTK